MFFVWPVPVFLGAAAALIVVLMLGRRLFPGTYVSRRAFWCPFRRTNVRVEFRESIWDRRALDIEACSAISPPLECEKGCLFLAKFPPIKERSRPSVIDRHRVALAARGGGGSAFSEGRMRPFS